MKKKYAIEIILFMTYTLFAMSWKTGDILIASYGFSTSQSAILTNAINASKVIGCISAAGIITKLGNRKTFTYSTFLIVLGILLPFVQSFSLIFIIRFVLGLGGALVLVAINPIVSKLFSGEELTVVNGLNAVAFNVGLAVVLTFIRPIATSPKTFIIILSLIVFGGLILWLILSKELEDNSNNTNQEEVKLAAKEYTIVDGLKDKFNIIFSLSYSGLLAFYLVAFTFMKAENVVFVIYAGVIGALVGTFWAKKFEDKLKLVRISAFLQLVSAIGFIAYYDYSLVKVIGLLLGFFIFFPMPAFVTLAFTRKDVTPRKISVTFSIFWSISYLVSIVLLQIFAFLTDNTENMIIPFIFIICAEAFFFIGTTFFLKRD